MCPCMNVWAINGKHWCGLIYLYKAVLVTLNWNQNFTKFLKKHKQNFTVNSTTHCRHISQQFQVLSSQLYYLIQSCVITCTIYEWILVNAFIDLTKIYASKLIFIPTGKQKYCFTRRPKFMFIYLSINRGYTEIC
jgi:hypothetical protein